MVRSTDRIECPPSNLTRDDPRSRFEFGIAISAANVQVEDYVTIHERGESIERSWNVYAANIEVDPTGEGPFWKDEWNNIAAQIKADKCEIRRLQRLQAEEDAERALIPRNRLEDDYPEPEIPEILLEDWDVESNVGEGEDGEGNVDAYEPEGISIPFFPRWLSFELPRIPRDFRPLLAQLRNPRFLYLPFVVFVGNLYFQAVMGKTSTGVPEYRLYDDVPPSI